MHDKAFLDTNILIYLYSESEVDKRKAACNILDNHYCVSSLQAFNEACNVWFKRQSWGSDKIREHLDNAKLVCDEVLTINRDTINLALSLKEHYGYSYYYCLMLASALESNCTSIMTEDMSNGQIINEQLKIVNPFVQAMLNKHKQQSGQGRTCPDYHIYRSMPRALCGCVLRLSALIIS